MRYLLLLWSFALALGQLPAQGQTPLRPDDALEQALRLLEQKQPDAALKLLHQALHRLQQRQPPDPDCARELKTELAKCHYHEAHFDSARVYLHAAAKLAQQQGYLQEYALLQLLLGSLAYQVQESVEAVRALQQAIATARQTRDSVTLGIALRDLSRIYHDLGSLEQSHKLQASAHRIFKALGDSLWLSVLFYDLGGDFEKTNPDSMLHYRRLAYELVRNASNKMRMGEVLYGLGHAYKLNGNLPAALTHYHRAMGWLQVPRNRGLLWQTWAGLMQTHLRSGRPDSAAFYAQRLDQALQAYPTAVAAGRNDLYLELARYYESVGMAKPALTYLHRYVDLQDSIQQAQKRHFVQIIELGNQLENESLRRQVTEAELARKTHQQWAYGSMAAVLAALLVVAVAVALRMRRLKRQLARSLVETERMHAELQATNKKLHELGQFRELLLGTIVHDLKTPLNSIIGLTMLPLSERNRELILRSGKKMLAQVHDLLDIQRLEQARLELKLESCRVDELIEQAVSEVLFEAQTRRIDLAIGKLQDDLHLRCDRNLIQRVLVNLLTNATKFSPVGSTVEVAAREVPEGLLIEVNDQGPGVPEHLREVIFERYFQAQSKELGVARSTGIGLTFCKLAVEAHGGRIGVENRPAGGASFRVMLPQISAALAADSAIDKQPDAESA